MLEFAILAPDRDGVFRQRRLRLVVRVDPRDGDLIPTRKNRVVVIVGPSYAGAFGESVCPRSPGTPLRCHPHWLPYTPRFGHMRLCLSILCYTRGHYYLK